jgi:hypothetical protein
MRVTAVRDRVSPPKVLATTEARASLPQTSREFAKKGAKAAPVFFGAHRRATGVMLSYERYLEMLDLLDDLTMALEIRRHDRADDGSRLSLDELIRGQGLDPSDFGLD